jgi:hypothetical protein
MKAYLPTPEEIDRMKKIIRAEWAAGNIEGHNYPQHKPKTKVSKGYTTIPDGELGAYRHKTVYKVNIRND